MVYNSADFNIEMKVKYLHNQIDLIFFYTFLRIFGKKVFNILCRQAFRRDHCENYADIFFLWILDFLLYILIMKIRKHRERKSGKDQCLWLQEVEDEFGWIKVPAQQCVPIWPIYGGKSYICKVTVILYILFILYLENNSRLTDNLISNM